MLSSLEESDRKMLGIVEQESEDDGIFISPEELTTPQPPVPPRPRGGEALQSDLLSRISGELRSIKAEIGTLKNNYDTMISTAASIAPSAPKPIGQTMPEGTAEDLKKLLGYLDRLLESLPEDKIDEFARSEYFELYRKTFEFFGLV